jgi:hypothetical protein
MHELLRDVAVAGLRILAANGLRPSKKIGNTRA